MWDKVKGKNGITGLGALFLSIASFTAQLMFTPEGVRLMWWSPLGASTAILFILGIGLIGWSIFKHDIGFLDKVAELEKRKKYLPQLKKLYEKYINRIEYLATHGEGLYDLTKYAEIYPISSNLPKKITKYSEKIALLSTLVTRLVMLDNILFRQIQENDSILFSLGQQMDTYNANVKDKKVRNFTNGLRKATHMAYSYYIYTRLNRLVFDKVLLVMRGFFWLGDKMQNRWRKHHYKINMRIDDLLRGGDFE